MKKENTKHQNQKNTGVHGQHKDQLFRLVFQNKKDLLELYNAIRGTNYMNTEELQVTTIQNALYMGVRNDLSFLVDHVMNLYEHQSTVNPNMPLRGLEYFAKLYKKYIKQIGANIYGSSRIPLPYPQYIIFYNGTQAQPERKVICLSDSYMLSDMMKKETNEPALECRAVMLNINFGRNKELMKKCKKLSEYAEFVECVREKASGKALTEEIMDEAIAECIEKDILKEILTEHRGEVRSMFQEYSWEAHLAGERKIGYEAGIEQGHAEERENTERERQKAEREKGRAEAERQKAEREKERAEAERQKAEREKERAEAAEDEIKKLNEKLEKLMAEKR